MKVFITTIIERLPYAKKLKAELEAVGINAILSTDVQKNGIWWNVKKCLEKAEGGHVTIIQDDIIIEDYKHLKVVHNNCIRHLEAYDFGLISLYTPTANFDTEKHKGYNCKVDQYFMGSLFFIVNKNFVNDVLVADSKSDQEKMKYHDEVRFRIASQLTGRMLCTLIGGPIEHDLSIKSALGHPYKAFGKERVSGYISKDTFDNLVTGKPKTSKADLKLVIS